VKRCRFDSLKRNGMDARIKSGHDEGWML
jgi:hypothetical protein